MNLGTGWFWNLGTGCLGTYELIVQEPRNWPIMKKETAQLGTRDMGWLETQELVNQEPKNWFARNQGTGWLGTQELVGQEPRNWLLGTWELVARNLGTGWLGTQELVGQEPRDDVYVFFSELICFLVLPMPFPLHQSVSYPYTPIPLDECPLPF